MNAASHICHSLPPVGDKNSEILILGSFPSVLSRKNSFYYGNPNNRFWSVLCGFFKESIPATNDEKERFCLHHHIALYDVIEECDIDGSKDSSIKNPIPSNLLNLFPGSSIRAIVLNGQKAHQMFYKFGMESHFPSAKVITVPSTSPANAQYSLAALQKKWFEAFEKLHLTR